MATPPTATGSQFFLPVALAGVPLGENVVAAGEIDRHGSTQGTSAGLDHDKCGSRARFTDQEKLLLVRLCVLHGEEYLGPKEVFWARERPRYHRRLGKGWNARTIVTELLQKFKVEVAAAC